MKPFKSHIQYIIVGFGGAGSQIINQLSKIGIPSSRLHLFDTDKQATENNGLSNRYLLGKALLKGKGTFSNTDFGKTAYDEAKEYLNRLSNEDCLFIVVRALGGGTYSAMAPLFTQMLNSKKRKFIIVTKWPDDEQKINIGIAHIALNIFGDFTDKLLMYKGDVVKSELILNGKEIGYQEINKRISNDIKDLLTRSTSRIIRSNSLDEVMLQDNFIRIKFYIEGFEWIVGQDDDAMYLSRANVAMIDTIYSGHTELYINTSRKFEELTAEIFKQSGYETKVTTATRDKGIDIRLKMPIPFAEPIDYVVQTKMKGKGKKVQRPELQQLEGARSGANADKAMFVSAGDFSKDSMDYARNQKINLHRFFDLLDDYKKNYEGKVLRFPNHNKSMPFTNGNSGSPQ